MGFVLVPVPAEHVLDIMRWVLFRSDAESGGDPQRDAMRILALVRDAEPELRALLELVAEATIREEPLRLRDLADELGQDAAEVTDAVEALNAGVLEGGRPFLELRTETVVGISGQTAKRAYLSMRPQLARVVQLARRQEAAG